MFGWSNVNLVYDDTQNVDPMPYVSLNVTGRYVSFTRNSSTQTVVCEIQVYGGKFIMSRSQSV